MFKKIITILPKKLTIGLTFFVVFIFINIFFISYQAHGANIIEFKPQIPIPGGIQGQTPVGTRTADGNLQSDLLSKYLKSLYDYSLALASILAAVVMMGGGLLWLTSGGSEAKVGQAKDLIFGSVVGLGLVFSSWIILNTVNPNLLSLKMPNIEMHDPPHFGCCVAPFSSQLVSSYYKAVYTTSKECRSYPEIESKKPVFYENMAPNPRLEHAASCETIGCCRVISHIFGGDIIKSSISYFNFPSTRNDCEGADYTGLTGTTVRYSWSETACNYSDNVNSCKNKTNGSKCFDYSTESTTGSISGGSSCLYSGQCGFCYNNFCLTKLGQLGEICGGNGSQGTCYSKKCDELRSPGGLIGYQSVSGGRRCVSGAWCCR